jgi:hypothetical protein
MSTELLAPPTQSSALTTIESSRAVQEVQASLIIAKRFPRDEKAAIDRILNACTRPSLAESALYQYSRGGTDITGPSIRLAEALAQTWGNLQFGIRELEQSNGESTVEAFCWDVESNTRQTKVFQVKHERHTRNGVKELTDPRDVYELVANQGARRLRSCILGIIPGDVVEMAAAQCEETLTAKADTSPEAQSRIVATFANYGVSKLQLEALIQRRLDAITPAAVVRLRKIAQSLKDGVGKVEDWFQLEVKTATVPVEKPKRAPAAPKSVPVSTPEDDQIPGIAPAPAKEQSLTEHINAMLARDGVTWEQVAQAASDGGLNLDPTLPVEGTPTADLQEVLAVWDAIVQVVKEGGAA